MALQGVAITGLKETMAILKAYDETQSKEIAKRMNVASTRVLNNARADVPSGSALSGWGPWTYTRDGRDLSMNGAAVKKNMRKTRANMRKRGRLVTNYLGLIATDAPGVIWHTAGKGSSKSSFVDNISNRYKGKRGIWKAFDEDRGAAVAEIEKAARDAQKIVQGYLNKVAGG